VQTETAKSSDFYAFTSGQGIAHHFNQVINYHPYILIGQMFAVFG
jgi:hypothetical protein